MRAEMYGCSVTGLARAIQQVTMTIHAFTTHCFTHPKVSEFPSIRQVLHGSALVLALMAAAAGAQAAEEPVAFKSRLWLESGFWSHHTTPRKVGVYRENNYGLGVEWQFARAWQLNAGHYRNSVNRPSNYLQVGWSPLNWSPTDDLTFTAGASVGVVNGYPKIHEGYFPTLIPMATVEYRRVGLNLVYIPSVGRIHGAYAAQLKLRAF
jgi:hypothetical protein